METPEQFVMLLKRSERRYWRSSVAFAVFIVNFEQNSHIIRAFPLLTLNKEMPTG